MGRCSHPTPVQESPFCWAANNGDDQATLNYTVQAQLEAIVFNINHPSVSFWSLGNESPWTKAFNLSFYTYVRHVDDTRPFMFDGGRMQPMPPLGRGVVFSCGFYGLCNLTPASAPSQTS